MGQFILRLSRLIPCAALLVPHGAVGSTHFEGALPPFIERRVIPERIALKCVLVPGKSFWVEFVRARQQVRFSDGPTLSVQHAGFQGSDLIIVATSPIYDLIMAVGVRSYVKIGEAGSVAQKADCTLET